MGDGSCGSLGVKDLHSVGALRLVTFGGRLVTFGGGAGSWRR